MSEDLAIARSVLSEQVKERLLEEIMAGRYPPGARIVETRVARELGTSQAPVREALRDLEGLGIVETSAFRGARVRRPDSEELLEAFIVRAELESLAARLAIPILTDDHVTALEHQVRTMQEAAAAGDAHGEAEADAAFHSLIVHLSGNATLERVWHRLEPTLRTYVTITAPGVDRKDVADQHLPVLEAIRRRDADEAAAVLHAHFAHAADVLRAAWDRTPPAADPEVRRAPLGRARQRNGAPPSVATDGTTAQPLNSPVDPPWADPVDGRERIR
jgi:DNA-binding GntR family transcriptional regulator